MKIVAEISRCEHRRWTMIAVTMVAFFALSWLASACVSDPSQGSIEACENGEERCEGECVDTETHPLFCGGCDVQCSAPQNGISVCEDGECGFECDDGFVRCGEDCVNIDEDPEHCGGCDDACPTPTHGSAVCHQQECGIVCFGDHGPCGDDCVDLSSDVENCGICGDACDEAAGATAHCDQGTCELSCDDGFHNCAGADEPIDCVDLELDPDNCGECNRDCGESVCSGGQCTTDCPDGTTACDRSCVDTDTSEKHCGECGNACERKNEGCTQGTCACVEGYEECDGQCIDFDSDADHCGGCENACGERGDCVDGECACPQGSTYCGLDEGGEPVCCDRQTQACATDDDDQPICECDEGFEDCPDPSGADQGELNCVDTWNNSDHCGSCGHVCEGWGVVCCGTTCRDAVTCVLR